MTRIASTLTLAALTLTGAALSANYRRDSAQLEDLDWGWGSMISNP